MSLCFFKFIESFELVAIQKFWHSISQTEAVEAVQEAFPGVSTINRKGLLTMENAVARWYEIGQNAQGADNEFHDGSKRLIASKSVYVYVCYARTLAE